MDEIMEEKKEELKEEPKAPPRSMQKWVWLVFSILALLGAAASLVWLMEEYDVLRIVAIVIWLLAALCFALAALCCKREEEAERQENRQV